MIEFYPQIKFVHVLCVILSGSLFAVRGMLMLAGSRLSNHAALRFTSYAIDTTLLTAALMLVTILHQYPFMQAWLTAKVLLLVVYALRRAATERARTLCYFLALAVFGLIVGVARMHNPLGWLMLLGS